MNSREQYRRSALAVLLALAGIPLAAFGSHGGDGGHGNGSGDGGGTTQDVCSVVAPGGQPTRIVPGTVFVREHFRAMTSPMGPPGQRLAPAATRVSN